MRLEGAVRAPPGHRGHTLVRDRDHEVLADPKGYSLVEYAYYLMAIACGITAYICYNFVLRGRIGYVFLPFLVTFVASVIGCAGCCCCIPSAGEEEDD